MPTFLLQKLVREKLPERIRSEGENIVTKTLDTQEFHQELLRKLREEAEEFSTATTLEDLLSEAADVCEVLEAMVVQSGGSFAGVLEKKQKKFERLGGLSPEAFLVKTTVAEGSSWVSYFREKGYEEEIPHDFRDRPKLSRLWADVLVFFGRKRIKKVCCASYRLPEKSGACKGCPCVYSKNSPSAWRRFLARWGRR